MTFKNEEKYSKDIGIYKIENTKSGGVYIGQTTECFQRRYWLHRWKLTNGIHDNLHLQRSFNKHGSDVFEFSVIEITDIESINNREKYWIEYYKTIGHCYNIQDGGQPERLCDYISTEARKRVGQKNRERLIGSKFSEETKKKMSESRKGKRVYRKNDSLTDAQARSIKQMLIEGISTAEIQKRLGIPYKSINMIISNDAYSTVLVDGWKDYKAKHLQEKIERNKRAEQICELLKQGINYKEVAKQLNLVPQTVRYYDKKINKQTSC